MRVPPTAPAPCPFGCRRSPAANMGIPIASFAAEAVVILGLTEAIYRVWNRVPLLQFPNFRAMRMDAALAGKGTQYDAVLAGFRFRTIGAVPD
jgi:hypothetical protein